MSDSTDLVLASEVGVGAPDGERGEALAQPEVGGSASDGGTGVMTR